MATSRSFRSRPLRPSFHSTPSSPSAWTVRCLGKSELTGERIVCGDGERRQAVAVKAVTEGAAVADSPVKPGALELGSLVANVGQSTLILLRKVISVKTWKEDIPVFIEKVIIDCRFFTILAVCGSLLGSVLCFIEGSFIVLESYFRHFNLSQGSDQGDMVQLLIEAIDMFLVGTALLIFGVGLFSMFVHSKSTNGKGHWILHSDPSIKRVPTWVEMQSVSQAKSKIGHTVMMILQVGLLEKFKSIPLVSGVDLACLAGVVLISSASIFILSRLSVGCSAGDK